MISSPSSRNVRTSPLASSIGCLPPWVISSRLPNWPGWAPDSVPEPNRSPACSWQPLTLWWATIWATVQYILKVLLNVRRWAGRFCSRMRSVSSSTSSSISKAPPAWSRLSSRYDNGCGSPSGRAGCAQRNGSSASAVTTQGEMVEMKLLDRNGPKGWYSHAWMSRADQSLSRQKPAICSAASATGIDSPISLPWPIQMPSSSS
ncbi:hypothetical protein D3C72_1589240 [compost metagenome]